MAAPAPSSPPSPDAVVHQPLPTSLSSSEVHQARRRYFRIRLRRPRHDEDHHLHLDRSQDVAVNACKMETTKRISNAANILADLNSVCVVCLGDGRPGPDVEEEAIYRFREYQSRKREAMLRLNEEDESEESDDDEKENSIDSDREEEDDDEEQENPAREVRKRESDRNKKEFATSLDHDANRMSKRARINLIDLIDNTTESEEDDVNSLRKTIDKKVKKGPKRTPKKKQVPTQKKITSFFTRLQVGHK